MECKTNLNALIIRFLDLSKKMNLDIPLPDLEKMVLDLYSAMENPKRNFHTMEHLVSFSPEDPLEELAVLYHDLVYWNVDLNWPEAFHTFLGILSPGGGGADAELVPFETLGTLETHEAGKFDGKTIQNYRDILFLFNREVHTPLKGPGLNEFFSALAFAATWSPWLDRESILAVATCIEATIPFRGNSVYEDLFQRLQGLGIDEALGTGMVRRAVHMANQDVKDFQVEDPGLFLSGTWNLLPELNPDLHILQQYTIESYTRALQGMLGFLGSLKPEQIFHSWNKYPDQQEFTNILKRTGQNLSIACGYLEAKLATAYMLLVLANESGGDAPLALFMGPVTECDNLGTLDDFLPEVTLQKKLESDPVYRLLSDGRTKKTEFDLKNSPLAAWVYGHLVQDGCHRVVCLGRDWMEGSIDNRKFLKELPKQQLFPLLSALEKFVLTRTGIFCHLKKSLGF